MHPKLLRAAPLPCLLPGSSWAQLAKRGYNEKHGNLVSGHRALRSFLSPATLGFSFFFFSLSFRCFRLAVMFGFPTEHLLFLPPTSQRMRKAAKDLCDIFSAYAYTLFCGPSPGPCDLPTRAVATPIDPVLCPQRREVCSVDLAADQGLVTVAGAILLLFCLNDKECLNSWEKEILQNLVFAVRIDRSRRRTNNLHGRCSRVRIYAGN